VLEIAKPHLGEVFAVYGDWTPRRDRRRPFSVEPDKDDPWQFRNMRVT
jgi:homospermidine synthase